MDQLEKQRFKVLLVEDSPTTRMLLKQLDVWYPKSPFEVQAEATDGKSALAYLEQNPCDLIITDIEMPNMDGIALLKRVKALYGDYTQVILISGHKTFEWARLALVHKAFDYLVKPVSKATLKESLDRFASKVPSRAGLQNEALPVTTSDLHRRVKMMLKREFWEYPNFNIANIAKVLIAEHKDLVTLEQKYKNLSMAVLNLRAELLLPHAEHELTRKAIKMILEQSKSSQTTIELAKRMFVNRSYLSQVFSASTGITLSSYLFKIRMYHARILLLTTKKNILDVAAILGYEDGEYFSRIFKRCTGMLPSEYRKKYKLEDLNVKTHQIKRTIG